MKKEFYLNIGLLILINFLVKPLYLFGIDAEVQNQVGNSEYGTYFAIFNFLFIFQWILDPGIQNYNTQALSKERETLQARLGYTLASKCLTAITFTLIAGILCVTFFGNAYWLEIILLCISMVILSFMVYLRTHFSAMGQYLTDSLLSSLDKFLLILGLGYILYFSEIQITITFFLMIQCLGLLIAFIIILILFTQRFGGLHLTFERSQIKGLLRNAFPYAIVFILMSLYSRMDGVMLKSMLDDNAVSAGIYAAGFRVYDAMNMVGFLFASLLLPMFANVINDNVKLNDLYDSALRLLLFVTTLMSVTAYFYSADLMELIYTAASHIHVEVFGWLAISFYLVALAFVFGTLISASGDLKLLNWLFVIGIPINFALNWYLITEMQAVGASIATCITQAVILIGQIVLAHRQFHLKFNVQLVLQYCLLFGVIFATTVMISHSLNLHFIIEVVLIGIIAIAYILGSRFLRLDFILGARTKAS